MITIIVYCIFKEHNAELFPKKAPLSGYQIAQAGLAIILKEQNNSQMSNRVSGEHNLVLSFLFIFIVANVTMSDFS